MVRVLNGFRVANMMQVAMAEKLNALDVKTPRSGQWSVTQVRRTLERIALCQDSDIATTKKARPDFQIYDPPEKRGSA